MIKTIIFDLGGVYFTNGTKIAIDKISKKYKIKKEELEEVLKPGSEFGKLYRKGKISGTEFFKKLKDNFDIKSNNRELAEIWFGSYKPIKEVVKIVKDLKRKEFKIYFLSDNVKDRADYLQAKYDFTSKFIGGGVFS
ncbi:hypothetical protein ISS07_02990 [Candidatus Woesearchaeota archaeon]|nr:hypothetical protein [Candidatus Woesearchaeota archaeon]